MKQDTRHPQVQVSFSFLTQTPPQSYPPYPGSQSSLGSSTQYSFLASHVKAPIPPQKLTTGTKWSASTWLKSVHGVNHSAYPLGTTQRGLGSEMQMASDGQGREQTGLGGRGRRRALAIEAARVMYAAVLKAFMLIQFVTCVRSDL